MTLSLAIALLITADLLLLAGLAYVMSRARNLTPHLAAGENRTAPAPAAVRQPERPTRRLVRPAGRPLAAARS